MKICIQYSHSEEQKEGVLMSKDKANRMSPQEMRKVMLANAKVLASERFKTSAPEISGQRRLHKSRATS